MMHVGLFTGVAVPLLGHFALGYEVQTPPLDTDWTYDVGTDPWPEYPRPQLQRENWQSLNGIWKFNPADGQEGVPAVPVPGTLSQDVLVPSCLESGLSGIQTQNITTAWFETEFNLPKWSNSSERILLNFEAVDYEATVYVNGEEAGFHRGGYWRFTVDVTKFVKRGANTLQVHVFDPTDMEGYVVPVGKQTRYQRHIFYTPCTGIWQPVWLETVPATHITKLDLAAGADGLVAGTVWSSQESSDPVTISVLDDGGEVIASHKAKANQNFEFTVDEPELWSLSSPTLYNLTVQLGSDEVSSYTGFRTISIGEIDGVKRPLINGKFEFLFGTLDQGWWPDGLMTPPNREAMVYDLEVLKSLGVNMVRKHIKVEPDLFYQACDQLGIFVIQDMPSMPSDAQPSPDQQAEFERQLEILIEEHKNYPSIGTWVIYNEGWAQITEGYYPEFDLTARVKELDPSRLVIATSGWHDHGAGDFHDNHHYANPQCGTPFYSIQSTPYDPTRIAIQGEFGGVGHNISEEHAWKVPQSINAVNQTYEIDETLEAYNYRGHILLSELRDQVEKWACSAAVWTQTTDVEGEVNGFLTYDRRLLRLDEKQWKSDIQALYDAAKSRGGGK